jgi:hypothetical protein
MNYVSDCCGVSAVAGTLNTWTYYSNNPDDATVVTYGTCAKCKKPSLFSEGE